MSKIDFNFQSAYEAKDTVRIAAEAMENEAKLVEGLITQTGEGWIGAGSEAYINYLQHVLSEIKLSASRLYAILSNIDISINAAEEADRLAREAIEEAVEASSSSSCASSNTSATYTPNSSSTTYTSSNVCENPVTEASDLAEQATAAARKLTNSILGTLGKSHKRR